MVLSRSSYWAFISYSHADSRWASWLHRGLERYRIPRRLVGQQGARGPVPRRLFPVFLDRDELAGSSALGPELQSALRDARHLVVICSPTAARSHWVNEEIKYFKSLGKADRVLALIVAGEPNAGDERECFPEALRFEVDAQGEVTDRPTEPIAADARPDKDGKAKALLKLLAGLLGIGFDDLRQREMQARHRRMAFVTALASSVAAVTAVLAVLAMQARDDAQRRQAQAEDLIEFMLGDLRERLEPIGRLDVLEPVGDKAMDYFATLDDKDVTDAVLSSRARALRQIGEVRLKQGRIESAVTAIDEALHLYQMLLARHPGDAGTLYEMSLAAFTMGGAYLDKGQWSEAGVWVRRQLDLVNSLASLEPQEPKWQAERGDAIGNLGAIAYFGGDMEKARAHYREAADVQRALYADHPRNPQFILPLIQAQGWLSSIAIRQRDWSTGQQHALEEKDLLDHLVALRPDDANYRYRRVLALLKVLFTAGRIRPLHPADPEMVEALELCTELAALDPQNIDFVRTRALIAAYLIDAWLLAGEPEQAKREAALALDLSRQLFARSPEVQWTLDDLLKALLRSAHLALLQDAPERARELLADGRALVEREEWRVRIDAANAMELELLGWWLEGGAEPVQAGYWLDQLQQKGQQLPPALMLRYAALRGEKEELRRWHAELSPLERRHPFLRQFCESMSSCVDAAFVPPGAGALAMDTP